MKDLSTYFECDMHECDGAATPGSVMGMGNPMAPDGTNVGSGDMFPPRKKKKVKPGKENQDWPDDAGQGKANEGLLDSDFGNDDATFGLDFNDLLEQFVNIYMHYERPSQSDYESFFNAFKVTTKTLAMSSGIGESVMRASRGKKHVIIAFFTTGNMDYRKGNFTNVIEIRKFIENPRPQCVALGWQPNHKRTYSAEYHVNHPTIMNIKQSEWFVVPAIVWEKIKEKIPGL